MEAIRRAATAYYENLPVANKRYDRYIFSSMDKNGDGQINLKEYLEYLSKDNKTALAHPSLFRALDKNNNGSLDFEEEIRRVAGAYYEHLPAKDKKLLRKTFKAIDKNRDGQISLHEYLKYFKKKKATGFTHQSIFSALDKDDKGSLDFEEAIVLFYIMESGRAQFCKSCDTFLTDVYFSCSQCFFKGDGVSTYEICCDCYGGKKFKHHGGAIFCDNYTLLSRSRRLALQASKEEQSSVVEEIDMIAKAADSMKETLQAYIEVHN
ncbi:hypothetical protein SADUNF_Sadunf19G0030500 [Salix dunnii]|uniref:EF-hand domain-containing protein n=1 Tax=Salix dunnii TaxID=1413687 RepID=A0A835J3K6_9ROSI|nr:hypothetical protein SADUNF_Sadunf19G0030500 [Salix dunnii]